MWKYFTSPLLYLQNPERSFNLKYPLWQPDPYHFVIRMYNITFIYIKNKIYNTLYKFGSIKPIYLYWRNYGLWYAYTNNYLFKFLTFLFNQFYDINASTAVQTFLLNLAADPFVALESNEWTTIFPSVNLNL